MKSLLFAVLSLLAASTVSASDWIDVSNSDKISISFKKGSAEITKNKAGEEIVIVISRYVDKKTQQVALDKVYVKSADCKAGMGKLVTLNLDGKFLYENDFVNGAGSIAATSADVICAIWMRTQAENDAKGV